MLLIQAEERSWVVAVEAGGAEVFGVALNGFEHPFRGKVGQTVSTDKASNLLDRLLGRDEL